MQHVAIDLGGSKSQVCVREADGTIVLETERETRSLGRWLSERPPSRVVVEACAEAFAVADQVREAGHEVRVVASTLAPALGVGERGIKTDRRDARVLSQASCRIELPSVHVPSARARELKATLTARDTLVRSRTMLINSVRGIARTRLLTIPRRGAETFPQRATRALLEDARGISTATQAQLDMIEQLSQRSALLDAELGAVARQDPLCRRLMSVPGVGPMTAVRFMCTIDDASRFDDPHALQSYLGLTPGENSSSTRRHRTGITHAGCVQMRWLLVQASWTAQRTRPNDPMVQWARGVRERRGKLVATVALARKMAGILFALWRDGTVYNPMHRRQPAAAFRGPVALRPSEDCGATCAPAAEAAAVTQPAPGAR